MTKNKIIKITSWFILSIFILLIACSKDIEDDLPFPNDHNTKDKFSDEELTTLKDGFDLRREQAFESSRGKPLKRGAVSSSISSSGIPFYRSLSYSLVNFAGRCFWLEDQIEAANNALIEHCEIYIDKPDILRDGDSFYWSADELCRIVEFWGSNGSKTPGLLQTDTEDLIYQVMWQWAKEQSRVETSIEICPYLFITSANITTKSWDIEGSENHHIQRISTRWHFAKLLKEHPNYNLLPFDDGYTAEEHYTAWTKFIKLFLKERARKGLFIEFANDAYGMESLKGIYNFYDYGDKELRELTGKFLDLFWAVWAQEQINGVSGGSKARVYQGRESAIGATHFRKLAWYYLGIGEISEIKENIFSFITSDYRIPAVVMDLALDPAGRGIYEIVQRRLGLAKDGMYNPPVYRLEQYQGLIRYSYCTPEFIMGTFHCEALPENSWTMISSQNRWLGVIFEGDPNCRIFPQCEGLSGPVYNQHWGVQSKGSMIVQKLFNGTHSKYAGKMRIWFSGVGLDSIIEREGWHFTSSKGAYIAVKFVKGNTTWEDGSTPFWSGKWLVGSEQYSPIIIEVARKSDFETYQTFQQAVINSKLEVSTYSITRTSIYGDVLQLPTDYNRLPSVNDQTLRLQPNKVMDSPFVKSVFNSGEYRIQKGSRTLTLNFNH